MSSAKKNDYVQIKYTILNAADRKKGLPEDTAKQPYMALVKGFLVNDSAETGETVKIITPIGRMMEGELYAVNPAFGYDFGRPVPELMGVGPELHAILERYNGRHSK